MPKAGEVELAEVENFRFKNNAPESAVAGATEARVMKGMKKAVRINLAQFRDLGLLAVVFKTFRVSVWVSGSIFCMVILTYLVHGESLCRKVLK